jgi:hypothetical protein
VIAEAFVNPLDFIFDSLLGSVYEFEHPDDYLVVGMVLFAELLDYGNKDATQSRYCRSNNERGIGIHVRKPCCR